MASASIGYHAKKVIFYNVNGFWDDLLALLHRMREQRFARKSWENFCLVANNIEELKEQLK
jgi:predicted Rossmann-fold nucleotide-binding protein